ncbi:MAG TPA: hypothetical protein VGS08_04745 [Candidatus Saccharimonadales bacterium]|nr:hypothetical protein [Candidatus Saccharimonadales bacterium]
MKRFIFGLLAIVSLWEFIKLPVVSNTFFLFIVAGINPLTNRPLSFAAMLGVLTCVAICGGLLIFSRELYNAAGAFLELLIPHRRRLQVGRQTAADVGPDQLQAAQPPLEATLQGLVSKRKAAGFIRILRLSAYIIRMTRSNITRRLGKLQQLAPDISAAQAQTAAGLQRAGRSSGKMTATVALELTAAEAFLGQLLHRVLNVLAHSITLTVRALYKLCTTVIVGVMVLAGYLMLATALSCFIAWEFAVPYILRMDRWLASLVHGNEGADTLIKLMGEATRTFGDWYRLVRNTKDDIYR